MIITNKNKVRCPFCNYYLLIRNKENYTEHIYCGLNSNCTENGYGKFSVVPDFTVKSYMVQYYIGSNLWIKIYLDKKVWNINNKDGEKMLTVDIPFTNKIEVVYDIEDIIKICKIFKNKYKKIKAFL